jgi:hypothetical protein
MVFGSVVDQHWFNADPDPGLTKNNFFFENCYFVLFLSLHEGQPSYETSLQPSKLKT